MQIKNKINSNLLNNAFEIADLLLEKYGLKESPDLYFQKVKSGQAVNIKKIGIIIRKIANKELQNKKITEKIQQEFALSAKTAEKLSQELQKNFLPTQQTSIKTNTKKNKRGLPKITKTKTTKTKASINDKYREPVL